MTRPKAASHPHSRRTPVAPARERLSRRPFRAPSRRCRSLARLRRAAYPRRHGARLRNFRPPEWDRAGSLRCSSLDRCRRGRVSRRSPGMLLGRGPLRRRHFRDREVRRVRRRCQVAGSVDQEAFSRRRTLDRRVVLLGRELLRRRFRDPGLRLGRRPFLPLEWGRSELLRCRSLDRCRRSRVSHRRSALPLGRELSRRSPGLPLGRELLHRRRFRAPEVRRVRRRCRVLVAVDQRVFSRRRTLGRPVALLAGRELLRRRCSVGSGRDSRWGLWRSR